MPVTGAYDLPPVFGGGSINDAGGGGFDWTFGFGGGGFGNTGADPYNPNDYSRQRPISERALDPSRPPTRSYPPPRPAPLPGNYNPRPGLPQAPLAGQLFNGLVGTFVKANLLTSVLMQIGQELFNQLPQGDETGGLLNKATAARLDREFGYQRGIIGTGPPRRGGARRAKTAANPVFAKPPPGRPGAIGGPGSPLPKRANAQGPFAAAPTQQTSASGTEKAPVAPGGAAAKPGAVTKSKTDPFSKTNELLRKAQAAKAASAALPAPAPEHWYTPFLDPFKESLKGFYRGELQRSLYAQRRPRGVRVTQPEPPPLEQPLTDFQGQRVGYTQATDTCAPKKRKPGKPRTVCYQGTYTERSDGLTKVKKRKIPCRQSRKKLRS